MSLVSLLGAGLLAALAAGAASGPASAPFVARMKELRDQPATAENAAERFHTLLDLHWAYRLAESPELATELGFPGHDDRWSDESPAAVKRRQEEAKLPLEVLATIDRAALSETDQLNYDLFRRERELDVAGDAFPSYLMPISQMGGVQQQVPRILSMMAGERRTDYENQIARLAGVSELIDQVIARLELGREAGVTPPRIILRDVPQQIASHLVEDPAASPLLAPFLELPATLPEGEREALRERAFAAYREHTVPAFRRLHEYFVGTYLPATRESIACGDLPDGQAWYAYNARYYTTTGMTPEEIHRLGLAEVARLRAAMQEIIDDVGFQGSFADFTHFLRSDPRFYYERAEDLVVAYRDISKRADPELAKLFGRLPQLPYGVEPVPAYAERSQTTAYYEPGSLAGGRPGMYFVNTYNLPARPKWEMEALSLHEAVPGHHLQISLAQELEDLPSFRRYGHVTAFVEGWALYGESLGEVMGFYRDPYSRFGQLTYEMWRAVRLVVDTGMHVMGWSRQQAIDYFRDNASKTEHDVVVEIDRYISWPGQALAYKIGQLKIQELRAVAEAELGERFDVRAFHDRLLGAGPLPLDVLETRMRAWVAAEKQRPQ